MHRRIGRHDRAPTGWAAVPRGPAAREVRSRRSISFRETCAIEFDPSFVPVGATHVVLDVELDLPPSEARRYEHSKLYWSVAPAGDFCEDDSTCVHLRHTGVRERIAIRLADGIAGSTIRFRFDPAPLAIDGSAIVGSPAFATAGTDGPFDRELLRRADLEDHKDRVRRSGAVAEAAAAEVVDLPQTISIELTARCNLTCTHCSSHGTVELHQRHNRMAEMPVAIFERLADEVFPGLTTVGLVGRGEPLLVTDRLWSAVCSKLREHQVRLTLVTNGTLTSRRLDEDVVPLIETVHFSVDGGDAETMAANRGGASLDHVLDAIAEFDRRRRAAHLARWPRIGISWTLKRNNVHQLPEFISRVAPLGIDQVTVRHLLTFHAHNREESLVAHPHLVNDSLRRTYEILEQLGIRSDCPPLMSTTAARDAAADGAPTPVPVAIARPREERERDGCMFVHRTAVVHADGVVPTCTAPFAARAGHIESGTSFASIWNGEILRSVRRTLGTPDEWDQCRTCWYREGRYQSQRQQFDTARTRFDLSRPDDFTRDAWDFEHNTQDGPPVWRGGTTTG